MDAWKDLFCNKWFRKLEDYGNRWGIAHFTFGGESIAEIYDSDLNRLISTWESLLNDLQSSDSETTPNA